MKVFKTAILILFLIFLSGLFVRSAIKYTGEQALFNVDALERNLQAFYEVNNYYPETLGELPKFTVINYQHGLSLKLDDFIEQKFRGYRYHYSLLDEGRFVLSASPLGVLSAQIEFGITENGLLKYNDDQVDARPDMYDEVVAWDVIKRFERMHSL